MKALIDKHALSYLDSTRIFNKEIDSLQMSMTKMVLIIGCVN